MEFLTDTDYCPNCGTMRYTVDEDSAFMSKENTDSGLRMFLYIPIECHCGWTATEKWWLSFIEYESTSDGEPPVRMHDLHSSVIQSIGFDTMDRILYVKFVSSEKLYKYAGVKPTMFVDFLDTDHPGQFYNNNIRGQYYHV